MIAFPATTTTNKNDRIKGSRRRSCRRRFCRRHQKGESKSKKESYLKLNLAHYYQHPHLLLLLSWRRRKVVVVEKEGTGRGMREENEWKKVEENKSKDKQWTEKERPNLEPERDIMV